MANPVNEGVYEIKTRIKKSICACLIIVISSLPGLISFDANAEALRNQPPGSYGWVRAGGKIADIDDASAVAINPANLIDIEKSTVLIAPAFDYISADIKTNSGMKTSAKDSLYVLPGIFVSSPFSGNTNLAWGFGVSIPYGQAVEYDEDFVFRFQTPHFSELAVINVSPALSYRVNKNISIGATLNLSWSQLELRQAYPWALITANPLSSDGLARFKGDGTGIGIDLGLTWQLTDKQRLALTYKSSSKIDYDGDFRISNAPIEASALGITDRSNFKTSINYPSIFTLGYGIDVNEKLNIGIDVEYVEWSNIKRFDLDIGNNAALFPSTVIPGDWEDTYTFGFGFDYKLNDNQFIRGGFWHLQNPIPARTQQPNLPESDENVYTIGYGMQTGRHKIEASYGYVDYKTRIINNNLNPAFNGHYDKEAQIIAISWQYDF